jgi:hypothetical protein
VPYLIGIAAAGVKPNTAGIRRTAFRKNFKRSFEIGITGQIAILNSSAMPWSSRDLARCRTNNFPALLLNYRNGDDQAVTAFSMGVKWEALCSQLICIASLSGFLPALL